MKQIDLATVTDLELIEVTMDAAREIATLEQIKRAAEVELAKRVEAKKKADKETKENG